MSTSVTPGHSDLSFDGEAVSEDSQSFRVTGVEERLSALGALPGGVRTDSSTDCPGF
jgi:hypothetical protein